LAELAKRGDVADLSNEDGCGGVTDPGDLQKRRCQRVDEFPDRGLQVTDTLVEVSYFRAHICERSADVRAQLCCLQQGGQRTQILGPGEVARRVVKPDVHLRLELIDDHCAALDEVGPVIDQDTQLTDVLVDAVPVQRRRCDSGMRDCGSVDGVRFGAGGPVQLAMGDREPAGDPHHFVARE
jgi:hypothetical protein